MHRWLRVRRLPLGGRHQYQIQAAAKAKGLESLVAALQSLLARHQELPRIVGLDPRIALVLEESQVSTTLREANDDLEAVSKAGALQAVYVTDTKGLTIAASN